MKNWNELARVLDSLEEALICAHEELEAIAAEEEWYLTCKTGRVNASLSHVEGILRKVQKMRDAAGIQRKPVSE